RANAATVDRDRLLARCDTGPMPWWPSTHRTPLTPREREIAGLAARRLGNHEIADMLHLSVRTVENHLQHVYTKLGISGRSDLG
ncbi:helix-turn-helix transcriptional regulator, partial [Actinosynnema sp. NPDC023658]|uniref:response regulator transcription factor n=1 Tax=Actinosynnema sp. NPDC023658 TaxID=3155465 RepID=UPI0033D11011